MRSRAAALADDAAAVDRLERRLQGQRVAAPAMSGVSRSRVSRLCGELETRPAPPRAPGIRWPIAP